MHLRSKHERRFFEWMLIAISVATTALFARMGPFKMVALNLFYLPIVLAGYFLGRFSAGVLALLCVIVVTIVTMLAPHSFAGYDLPIIVALALTVWGAVLGLTAILVGTLCDARAATVRELHTAYVGVVEVLTQYLQGGNAHLKTRSERIAGLSQMIGEELGLSQKQVDDVRVAALLHELGNVEVTTQVISRAFDKLEAAPAKHTFLGTDLVQSLGSVLEGALPLLAEQEHAVVDEFGAAPHATAATASRGARIIQAARMYDDCVTDLAGAPGLAADTALERLRAELAPERDDEVLDALERVVQRRSRFVPDQPVLA